jgi:DNA (cytosine-5)-methyltransferase 1
MANRLSVIDFFCGAGGFSEGFRMAGFDVIMGIDNWKPAIITHNANHGLHDTVKSILDFENIEEILQLPNSDVIVGSPPCVLFSLSNHGGNANKDLGVRLIKAFYRVIAVKKHQKNSMLKAWLMENVPNSRNYVDPSYTFRDLDLSEWAESEGLDPDKIAITVKENGDILSSNEYGSAQTRKRFVCGEITKTGQFPYPDKTTVNGVTLGKLFGDFPKPMGTKYDSSHIVCDPNYQNLSLSINNLHDHFYDSGVYEIEWQKAKDAKKHHPYMGIMSFPENQQKPSRTIMATRSASTREAILYKSELNRRGDGEYRTPTIREAAAIMGFPITYEFYGNESTKWRQVGNAVCVQLSFALAKKVKESLDIKLPTPKRVSKDLSGITFLDNDTERVFDKPPKRNPNSLFRAHPIKSGNITVDLTNRAGQNGSDWRVIAHAGTGQGYTSIAVTKKHRDAAKDVISKSFPEFIDIIGRDSAIKRYSKSELDAHNRVYGYISADEKHPYNIIQRIAGYISSTLGDNDTCHSTHGGPLGDLKASMPMSQAMSIYAMSNLVEDGTQ